MLEELKEGIDTMKTTSRFIAALSLITIGLLAGTGVAVAADTDNYAESFETYAPGDSVTNFTAVAGSVWTATEPEISVLVSTNYADNYVGLDYPIPGAEHTKVLNVQNGVTNTIDAGNPNQTNWVDVVIKPVLYGEGEAPDIPPEGSVAAAYFNSSSNLVLSYSASVFDGILSWLEIPDVSVAADDWIRLTIAVNMKDGNEEIENVRYFKVYVNGEPVTNGAAYTLPNAESVLGGSWFASGALLSRSAPITNVIFKGTGYIDDLVVTSEAIVFAEREATYIEEVSVSNVLMYGQTLAVAGVSGTATNAAGSNVVGQITFDDPAYVPNAGTNDYDVTFTPDAPGAYLKANGSVEVVTKASTPAIQTLPSASELTVGETLGDVVLTGGSVTNVYNGAIADGDFAFVLDATNVPPEGTTSYQVVFTPSNAVNYLTVTGSIDVVVVAAPSGNDPPPSWLADTGITEEQLNTDLRGDGMTPRQAWVASTHPTDTNFSFEVTDIRRANGSNTIEWISVFVDTNLPPFGIWARTNLMDTTYDQIGTYPRTAGVTPSTPVTNVWSQTAPAYPIFYRVAATNAPSAP